MTPVGDGKTVGRFRDRPSRAGMKRPSPHPVPPASPTRPAAPGFGALLVAATLGVACSADEEGRASDPVAATPAGEAAEQAAAPDYYGLICATCHGVHGEGNAAVKAPSIAGLPDYYVLAQLGKFRSGQRGYHEEDAEGAVMRAIALSVTPEMAAQLAPRIESMPVTLTTGTGRGDEQRGKEIFYDSQCADCHRYNASGELVFGTPPLTGLQNWYIAGQIEKFAAGQRGTAEGDEHGAKMHGVCQYLNLPEDIDHIVAYVALLAERHGPGSRRERREER